MAGTWVAVATQRRKHVVRFSAVELLDVVAPNSPRGGATSPPCCSSWRSPPWCWVRPAGAGHARRPRSAPPWILAVDVSLSMEATDVRPNRLAVAQEAARAFVEDLPDDLDVGLVTFHDVAGVAACSAGTAYALLDAIDRLPLGEGTAIGEAVVTSLDAVAEALPGEDGEPVPARIVVMSDGETTSGISNEEAAERAALAGVPVDTIAFGTLEGTIEDAGDGTIPVPVAPEPLADLAAGTGGDAYEAGSSAS